MRWLILLMLSVVPAWAEGERAGSFDYYVLALSWSPNWCLREGDRRAADQCDPRHDFGWTLHGLWPQFERGWPSYCRGGQGDPSRRQTAAMADIMGSAGLAWHQWKKHGRCSGLSSEDYFALSREAYGRIARPEVFRKLADPVRLPAKVVEEAFWQTNPGVTDAMTTVTCSGDMIAELRICLTRDLTPRPCSADVRRDCTAPDALFTPVR